MNEKAHIFSGFTGLMNLAIAISLWLNLGGFGRSAAWLLLHRLVPNEVWPLLFFVAAVYAFIGVFNIRVLRVALRMSGGLMAVWAIASFIVAYQGTYASLPGAFLLAKYAGADFMFAAWSFREQRVEAVAEKVTRDVEAAKQKHLAT